MTISFSGQTILVTGGSRGIGKALALGFLEAEGKVIVTGTNGVPPVWLADYADKDIYYAQLDLADNAWPGQLADILVRFERIDVCVNNAGINKISLLPEIEAQDLTDILDVNLRAPILIAAEISQKMIRGKYGRIVNIASIFGVVTKTMRNAYTASKAGLIGATKTMAVDLGEHNILVNAVSPGFVDTELTRRVLGETKMREAADRLPLKRLARVEDIVSAVLFLASDQNTYITGQNLVVDGGFTLE